MTVQVCGRRPGEGRYILFRHAPACHIPEQGRHGIGRNRPLFFLDKIMEKNLQ
jgi:hypothetical protein